MFEVEFKVCGGWFGLLLEALERWMSSESLEEIWEKAVSWSSGNWGMGSGR